MDDATFEDKIRKCVFKYLDGQSDVQSLRFKDVREHAEMELRLEKESCKSGGRRQLLEQCIAAFIKGNDSSKQASGTSQEPMAAEASVSLADAGIAATHIDAEFVRGMLADKKDAASTKASNKTIKSISHASALVPSFNESLRQAVNDYLDQFPDPTSIKFKDVRDNVESILDLPKDALKTGTNRNLLEQFVSAFVKSKESIELSKIVNDPSKSSGEVIVKGRFSAKESAIIQKEMDLYCEAEAMQPQDLVVFYREDNRRPRHRRLVESILAQLPHRTSTSVLKFIQRSVMRKDFGGKFTEDEKAQLMELVKQHGTRFSVIGRAMGKIPDDCQQVYLRMQRKKSGVFTTDEDSQIISAVLTTLKLPVKETEVLPDTNISWTAVAQILNKERTALDYNRRWKQILSYNLSYGYKPHIVSAENGQEVFEEIQGLVAPGLMVTEQRGMRRSAPQGAHNKRKIALLQYLLDLEVDEDSDVRWTSVDKALGTSGSWAAWKSLQKECPAGDEAVSTFPEKLEYLRQVYREKVGLSEEELPKPRGSHRTATSNAAMILEKANVEETDDEDDDKTFPTGGMPLPPLPDADTDTDRLLAQAKAQAALEKADKAPIAAAPAAGKAKAALKVTADTEDDDESVKTSKQDKLASLIAASMAAAGAPAPGKGKKGDKKADKRKRELEAEQQPQHKADKKKAKKAARDPDQDSV